MANKPNKQPTSNFAFEWDKTKPKAKALVFAKRKQPAAGKPSSQAKQTPTVVKPSVEPQKPPKKPVVSELVPEGIPKPPTGHIKRKHKKDKLLGENVETSASGSQQNYNNLFRVQRKDVYVNTTAGRSVSEKVFSASGTFADLGVHAHLVSNLEKHGFGKPTNVQSKAIPVITSGKNTLIRSQTGSGKTLAYAVPIVNALQAIEPRLKRTDGVQAIIVVPTRELALQVHELFDKINTFQWLVVGHLCGGESRKSEKERLRRGLSILIGTPGRLLDHVKHTASMKVDAVRCLVLDEADRLLDMGFRKDIISLVEALDKTGYNPMKMLKRDHEEEGTEGRQNIMLSATLTKGVSELASFTMSEHTYIDALDIASNAFIDSYVIPDTVRQEFIVTHAKHRLFTLAAFLLHKAKEAKCKVFVFMASTHMVDFYHALFDKHLRMMPMLRGKPVYDESGDQEEDEEDEEEVMNASIFKLHGNMAQTDRRAVFKAFNAAQRGVLICTDVAARGIDVPTADCIVQYTGPQMDDDYLHRVGRTGRAGQSGEAVIFLTHEEQSYVEHLREHRVFLQKRDTQPVMECLARVMAEPEHEQAAIRLQRHFEKVVARDAQLQRLACFAYSSWSRFYNTYPGKMRTHFNFKSANLGHYVTSFALQMTPTQVARYVRGEVEVSAKEAPPRRLNKKLANHSDNAELQVTRGSKRQLQNKTLSHTTSEYGSGLEPLKKKAKKSSF